MKTLDSEFLFDAERDPNRPTISVSKVTGFLICPRRTAYRYIYKKTPEHVGLSLVFGRAWHKAMEEFYGTLAADGERMDSGDLANMAADNWRAEIRATTSDVLYDDDNKRGRKICNVDDGVDVIVDCAHAFAAAVCLPDEVLGIEKWLCSDLADPDTGVVFEEQLVGRLDVEARFGETRCVIDHKTGARKSAQGDIDRSTQGRIYQAMTGADVVRFQQITRGKAPSLNIFDVKYADGQIERAVRMVAGVLKAFRRGDDYPVESWACPGCEYRMLCQGLGQGLGQGT